MESAEESEAPDFSQSIDIVASEYGWTLDQIFDLTADQMSVLLKAGEERRRNELVLQTGAMRLAIASVFSKEGQRAYENFINEIRESRIVQAKEVSMKDLSKVGLAIK